MTGSLQRETKAQEATFWIQVRRASGISVVVFFIALAMTLREVVQRNAAFASADVLAILGASIVVGVLFSIPPIFATFSQLLRLLLTLILLLTIGIVCIGVPIGLLYLVVRLVKYFWYL